MGEQIADLVAKKLGVKELSRTKEVELLGSTADERTEKAPQTAGVNDELVKRMMDIVGTIDEEIFMPAIRLLMSYAL